MEYFSIVEQLRKDNEDESLGYYLPVDESSINADGTQKTDITTVNFSNIPSEKQLSSWEIFAEKVQRLRALGYKDSSYSEKFVLYSSWQHFQVPGYDPPLFACGKLDISI